MQEKKAPHQNRWVSHLQSPAAERAARAGSLPRASPENGGRSSRRAPRTPPGNPPAPGCEERAAEGLRRVKVTPQAPGTARDGAKLYIHLNIL